MLRLAADRRWKADLWILMPERTLRRNADEPSQSDSQAAGQPVGQTRPHSAIGTLREPASRLGAPIAWSAANASTPDRRTRSTRIGPQGRRLINRFYRTEASGPGQTTEAPGYSSLPFRSSSICRAHAERIQTGLPPSGSTNVVVSVACK
jgi:hypothetical protein